LRDLEAGRTYHYQILTRNGQVRKSGSFQVPGSSAQASAAAGEQAVRITNGPVVEQAGDTSAVIAWSTNVKSGSVVRYGESMLALNRTADAPWGDTTHRVTITGLKPNTRYYFRVESAQAQGTGTQSVSRVSSFETVAPGAQAVRQ
jgi:predicted RecA/RadA family phage recombinase